MWFPLKHIQDICTNHIDSLYSVYMTLSLGIWSTYLACKTYRIILTPVIPVVGLITICIQRFTLITSQTSNSNIQPFRRHTNIKYTTIAYINLYKNTGPTQISSRSGAWQRETRDLGDQPIHPKPVLSTTCNSTTNTSLWEGEQTTAQWGKMHITVKHQW